MLVTPNFAFRDLAPALALRPPITAAPAPPPHPPVVVGTRPAAGAPGSRASAAAPGIMGVGIDMAAFAGGGVPAREGKGCEGKGDDEEMEGNAMEIDRSAATGPVQVAERWMHELQAFVEQLPNELVRLRGSMAELEEKRGTELAKCKTRDQEQELVRRIDTMSEFLRVSCRLIQSRVDESVLVERMKQMLQFFSRIPAAEKNQRSLLDSWNAMFDVNAVVPRTLAKDHCDVCKRPLVHNRKQSLLICTACAKVTEHLTPIAQGSSWMKNSLASQPENKRIRSVIAKLTQFRVGSPPIPSEVVLGVRHWLKSRNHVSQDALALPTPVTAALHALGYERYVAYSAKIALLVNGTVVSCVTDEQINEIVARLRALQLVYAFLQGRVERLAFCTNFLCMQICKLRGWDSLAASFPPQRTRKILSDQLRLWRTLLHYVRTCDPQHVW